MHLKTLTLRGFKSFASATTFTFEPGVTCVVGPNGSGKSNVVDALAWVMGEQGAKTLRGGKMEDVIFSGTSGRAPLGRAEVALTIDNTDGVLPIDYSEVTISRTLFRSGGSEYAINGTVCRLLDIQELLSDTGMGREMHVIVGQGQLDTVLRATPEDRRGFIEEAAGVLKHRRRKEKALRKLDAMQANLQRLSDLTVEVRRQLGPLGRQAEVARKAATIQVDLRDAKARILADDLAQLTATLAQEIADEAAARARQEQVEKDLTQARENLTDAEREAARLAPALGAAQEVWYRLSSLRDRITSIHTLAGERLRHLSQAEAVHMGPDPDDLDAQAERVRLTEGELNQEVDLARDTLEEAIETRHIAESDAAEAEKAIADLMRTAADRREGLARLAGQVGAQRSKVEATQAEIGRLREALAEAERRGIQADTEFSALETQVAGVEEGEEGLDADHEAAQDALEAATAAVGQLSETRTAAERDQVTWKARMDALELSLDRKDGAGALLASDEVPTVGSLAALLGIQPGFEGAIAAALGSVADAVAVESMSVAVDALRHLRTEDAGRAGLLVATTGQATKPARASITLPDAAAWAADVVTTAGHTMAAVQALLTDVVVVADLAEARALVTRHPGITAVTRAGDLLSQTRAWGGSESAPSVLHLQAALDEARTNYHDATVRANTAQADLDRARTAQHAAQDRHDETLERLHESDAALAAVAEQLGSVGTAARAAQAEADRLRASLERATETVEADSERLEDLLERLDAAEEAPEDSEAALNDATSQRDRCARTATDARAAETEARLALRTAEERARALAGRAQSLAKAAADERAARARAAARSAARARQADLAHQVQDGARMALNAIEQSLVRAAGERESAEAARVAREEVIAAARAQVDTLTNTLRELTDVAHRDEVMRTQQQLRLEQLNERAAEELGMDPAVLMEGFGPHQMVPTRTETLAKRQREAASDDVVLMPYDRETQEKRLKAAERDLTRLGKVNPLALEEFAAMEERHKFLADQLTDLKKSRADLLEIVREIDERVERVFSEAFADTAAQFEAVFARMFPGGDGKLVLTDPSNMLTTGIEIEARPPGKRVKRLSLLSGGERSLTAVALLVAIFKARPSPFYVMDEVEAALDDVNLGRLLEIFKELQKDSQLIVITHQKRTMEIADALYGVTMRGDGVSAIISQRLGEGPGSRELEHVLGT